MSLIILADFGDSFNAANKCGNASSGFLSLTRDFAIWYSEEFFIEGAGLASLPLFEEFCILELVFNLSVFD